MSYAANHATALSKVRAAGARIEFTSATPIVDPLTGLSTGVDSAVVSGYAIGLDKGDPKTYERLGLTFSSAPSLFVVCEEYGAVPPNLALCQWGGQRYTVRDVQPFAPDGIVLSATVVVAQ